MVLKLHQLRLFSLYNVSKLIDFILSLLLIRFELGFHLKSLVLFLEKFIVRLRKELLHLV